MVKAKSKAKKIKVIERERTPQGQWRALGAKEIEEGEGELELITGKYVLVEAPKAESEEIEDNG